MTVPPAILGLVAVAVLVLLGAVLCCQLRVRRALAANRTERDSLQSRLDSNARQLQLLQRSVESSINAVIIADARAPDHPIVYTNPAFTHITGYSAAEARGRNCRFLQGPDTDQHVRQRIRQALQAGTSVHVVLRNYRKDGAPFWNDLHIAPIHGPDGELTHFVGIQHDISAQEDSASQLAFNAAHDALTRLPNRALLEDRAEQQLRLTRRNRRSLAVVHVDLDEFRLVNESLGHRSGDTLLCQVAERLRHGVRQSDTVARMAGDEFVVLLADLPPHTVEPVRQRVEELTTRLAQPYFINEQELRLTASAGIAMAAHDTDTASDLLRQADLAKERAKALGRNTYAWFTHDMTRTARTRVELRNALQHAIETETGLELYYQPQISGRERRIVGFEALIRWRHPDQGLLTPADFLPLAEETGLMIPLSHWILRRACNDAVTLNQDSDRPLFVSVNLSSRYFAQDTLIASVMATLKQAGLNPPLLELELTEDILLEQSQAAIDKLTILRSRGIRIAIDDFGTGYSSLSYLKHLPVDKLKLDRVFVQDVMNDPRDAAIVTSVLSLARALSLQVVAEGVETETQYQHLQGMGCDGFQGYLFARPGPLAAARALLSPC